MNVNLSPNDVLSSLRRPGTGAFASMGTILTKLSMFNQEIQSLHNEWRSESKDEYVALFNIVHNNMESYLADLQGVLNEMELFVHRVVNFDNSTEKQIRNFSGS